MNQIKQKRRFEGVVVSDRMTKTRVVRVDRVKMHPKYRKQFVVSRKFKVHDEQNQFRVGDRVWFEECRPYSKDKRWRIIRKI